MAMLCPLEVVSKDYVFPQSEHEAVEEFEHILVVAIEEEETFMNFTVYQKKCSVALRYCIVRVVKFACKSKMK